MRPSWLIVSPLCPRLKEVVGERIVLPAREAMTALKDLLAQNQSAILERWFQLILGTYPSHTSALLKQKKERFTNPVGYILCTETEALFKELMEGMNSDRVSTSLNHLMKIRSVQDFPPSQAVGLILLLKKAIGEVLKSEIQKEQFIAEWLTFYSKIDQVTLQAFDIYMDCREKICEVRVNRARAEREMALKMLERIHVLKEKPEKGED